VFLPDVLLKAYPTAYTLRIKPEIEIDSDSKCSIELFHKNR
jgi:hypothetical protein